MSRSAIGDRRRRRHAARPMPRRWPARARPWWSPTSTLEGAGAGRRRRHPAHEGGTALAVHVDVSDPDSAKAMADQTIAEFGGIDYLVNNAAIFGGMKLDLLLTVDWDYYKRFMSVNLDGALAAAPARCTKQMAKRGGCSSGGRSRRRRTTWQPQIHSRHSSRYSSRYSSRRSSRRSSCRPANRPPAGHCRSAAQPPAAAAAAGGGDAAACCGPSGPDSRPAAAVLVPLVAAGGAGCAVGA